MSGRSDEQNVSRISRPDDATPAPVEGLPWLPRTTDLGLTVVDGIASALQLDGQWSLASDRGFTWWGKDLAQHVWADRGLDDDGVELFRVHARTDVIRDFTCSEENLATVNAFAGFASTSAFAIELEDETVSLTASMWMNADTADWVRRLFAFVTAMQAADAQVKAPILAELTNASVASSAHPSSGPRRDVDDMLNVLEDVFVPIGREPSRWAGDDMQHAFDVVRTSPFDLLATGDSDGFTAELPFRSKSSLLQAITTEANPQVGNGLLLLLSLPMTFSPEAGIQQAHELNQRELASLSQAHSLGSWCWQNDCITHCSFFPNAMRLGGSDLVNLVLSAIVRARWVAERVYGDDWETNRDSKGHPLATPAALWAISDLDQWVAGER